MKKHSVLLIFLFVISILFTSCAQGTDTEPLVGGGLSRDTVDFDEENSQVNLTVAETLPSCVWYESGYCFYAYDDYGSLYRVLWTDVSELEENLRINVSYTYKKILTYAEYGTGWSPMYEISATSVTSMSRTYVTEDGENYKLSIPNSNKSVKFGREYIKYIPYIYDAVVDNAVDKLSASVAQYGNNSGYYFTIDDDGYLCLTVEVIAPLAEGEIGSCSDHKHIFFSERISSVGLKDNGPISSYIPPQPQKYDTLNFAVTSIYKMTIPSGLPEYAEAYKKMLSSFSGDGFLYEVQSSSAEREPFLYLIPETDYEDIGVSYYFNGGDTTYQVLVYSSQDARNISSLEKYYVWRFGAFNYTEEYDPNVGYTDTLYIYETADGKICALAQIDKTHYTEIRADKDKIGIGELKDLVKTLSYSQKTIEYLP